MLVTASPSHPAPDLPVCPHCGHPVRVAGEGSTHWHECPDCGPVDPVTARVRQIHAEWNGDDPEGQPLSTCGPKHGRRLTAGRNRTLLRRHEAGESVLALAAEHGVSPSWIRRIIAQERRIREVQRELDEFRSTSRYRPHE